MKRYVLLGALLAVGVIACQPPAPPQAACNTVNPEPASSVVVTTPVATDNDKLAVLLPTDIDEVQTDRVLADPTNIQAGDVIASNCNDGLLRKVTNVTTQSPPNARVTPQGIKKVYIETAEASLEEVIQAGESDINFGDLAFEQASNTVNAQGVSVQAVTGVITIKNAKFGLSAAEVTLNGKVTSTLDPKFKLAFDGSGIKTFEAGLSGSLAVDLTAGMVLKAAIQSNSERELWKGEFKRAFLIGAVPVVIVVTPRLLVGARAASSATGSVTVGIKPEFNMGFGLKYARNAADPTKGTWTKTFQAPQFALSPTFNYQGSTNVTASAYVRFEMDIKFYGIAGPKLSTEPSINLNLNPSSETPRATLSAGVTSFGGLNVGFKILGKGMDVDFGVLTLLDEKVLFNCTTTTCTKS
jgi:hypothetical protein